LDHLNSGLNGNPNKNSSPPIIICNNGEEEDENNNSEKNTKTNHQLPHFTAQIQLQTRPILNQAFLSLITQADDQNCESHACRNLD